MCEGGTMTSACVCPFLLLVGVARFRGADDCRLAASC